ncbi:O-antigen ligase family protein [Paenarthrobacter sp. NPDC092416]|uniref:O-antigen ligase family protein n=1 Tax=Paenarthrobacter sp. NPDC092416 TaxID=3364386 RepID=UPI00381A8C49
MRANRKALTFTPPLEASHAELSVQPGIKGHVSLLLKFAAFGVFFFPSNMIVKPLGAIGTIPLMVALLLLALWLCSVLFGLQNPLKTRHPGRLGVGLLWLGTCASYVALYSGFSGNTSVASQAAADRWLILVLASAGIVLVTAEAVRTLNDAMSLVRAILAGAFFCCLVAAIQFLFRVNPMLWIQEAMVGFTDNGGNTAFQVRGLMMRVAGSTFHSIELAVVCSMLLPLSIWRSLYDPIGRKWLHWTGTALLVFAIASTVSRSGVLGLFMGMLVFVPFLPRIARRWALVAAPMAMAALFLGIPGLVGTLTSSFTAGDSDPSLTTRTNNYPRVAEMFGELPFLGLGPGNYQPANALNILDNQYLNSLVTMGLVGFIGTLAYLTFPGISSLIAARASRIPALRALAGALAGGGIVAAGCSLTFDSMSFPVFALTYPFIVGLAGGTWIMIRRELDLRESTVVDDGDSGPPPGGPAANTSTPNAKAITWTP